jgi:hypothetical protein
MKIYPSHNTNVHYIMPPHVQLGMDPRFEGLNLEIVIICNKQHLL